MQLSAALIGGNIISGVQFSGSHSAAAVGVAAATALVGPLEEDLSSADEIDIQQQTGMRASELPLKRLARKMSASDSSQ